MEKSFIFNSVNGDRKYKAEDFVNYFRKLVTNGVFPNIASNLQVIADDTDMTVRLKAGAAWIDGRMYENTDDLILPIDVADGVLNRIDRIVIQLSYVDREIKAKVKKGIFASTPSAPSLQRDADIYELGIADISVNKGITSIDQSIVTDLRLNNNFCGIVNSLLQADTTEIFEQYQAWFNNTSQAHEEEFQTWFDSVKGQLSGDIAGNLSNQITALQQQVDEHSAEDASLTQKGHVQLSSSVTSESELLAATPKAVKTAMDRADAAFTSASNGKNQLETTIIGKKGTVSKVGEVATFNELNTGILSIPDGIRIKSVQKGNTSISAGSLSVNIPITTVDIAKSFVLVSTQTTNDNINEHKVMGNLSTATNLLLQRNANSSIVYITWQVIEFEGNVRVQSGQSQIGSSSTGTSANIDVVNQAKTFLVFSYKTNSGWSTSSSVQGYFNSNSNVAFSVYQSGTTTQIYWYVIEFL
ncbi:phage tail protein [Cytobacillus spongiae]|uniref:tail fiber protein n=1 Tax=Cytobacillus spongiae TaxID=2901381 RepID=UPI001F2EB614|nr:phage tail protein [Cytobacillus spongiae]UII56718.1 phage tail protein [Cytobacillus spongiae]